MLFDNDSIEVDFPAKKKRLAPSPAAKTVATRANTSKVAPVAAKQAKKKTATSKNPPAKAKPKPGKLVLVFSSQFNSVRSLIASCD